MWSLLSIWTILLCLQRKHFYVRYLHLFVFVEGNQRENSYNNDVPKEINIGLGSTTWDIVSLVRSEYIAYVRAVCAYAIKTNIPDACRVAPLQRVTCARVSRVIIERKRLLSVAGYYQAPVFTAIKCRTTARCERGAGRGARGVVGR